MNPAKRNPRQKSKNRKFKTELEQHLDLKTYLSFTRVTYIYWFNNYPNVFPIISGVRFSARSHRLNLKLSCSQTIGWFLGCVLAGEYWRKVHDSGIAWVPSGNGGTGTHKVERLPLWDIEP